MNKTLLSILNKVMLKELTPESASRLISVWFGTTKSSTCALDNLPDSCLIFKISNTENTFENGCEKCGHYHKIV